MLGIFDGFSQLFEIVFTIDVEFNIVDLTDGCEWIITNVMIDGVLSLVEIVEKSKIVSDVLALNEEFSVVRDEEDSKGLRDLREFFNPEWFSKGYKFFEIFLFLMAV